MAFFLTPNHPHSLFTGIQPEASSSRSTGCQPCSDPVSCIFSSAGSSTCRIAASLEEDSYCHYNQSRVSHPCPAFHPTQPYLTPPQTGAALKDHLPLPEPDGGATMVYDAVQEVYPHSDMFDTSDEAGPSSRRVAPAVREPISPPPTEHLNSRTLPEIDTTLGNYHPGYTPQSPSVLSDYDHDDESSIVWPHDSPHNDNDWASPTSTLLDQCDLGSSFPSAKDHFFDMPSFQETTFHDLESEPPPSSPSDHHSFFHSMPQSEHWHEFGHYNDPMDLDPLDITPHSPRPEASSLPPIESSSQQDVQRKNARPRPLSPSDFVPSSPSGRYHLSLPDYDLLEDGFMTPVPHSPRGPSLSLPELVPDDELFPAYVAPPLAHPSFPGAEGLYQDLPETISPALLGPSPPSEDEGLGLFVRPAGVEPPLVRSPSPDQDDFRFLDVQLDPVATNLDTHEFLNLRALRNRALDLERAARGREEVLSERVEKACHALLPATLEQDDVTDQPSEIRLRKHELHLALEARAEARKLRKREKQRSKEIGLLLELKMRGQDDDFLMMGYGDGPVNVKQLVASMLMKRRDTSRPLANRGRTMASRPSSRLSSLSRSVSYEDLSETLENIHISEPESSLLAASMDIDLASEPSSTLLSTPTVQ